jgi:hypothetical protein
VDIKRKTMLYTYWKGTLISKWFEIPEKECLQYGKDLIEKSLRAGVSIKVKYSLTLSL